MTGRETGMRRNKGFSLIELMIAVGIILVLAAISIPNLLRARMSANEAAAAEGLRTINSAMVMYSVSYPWLGYAQNLGLLGSTPCHPDASTPCLIDGALASGKKSGYSFVATAAGGPPALNYYATAIPIKANYTGVTSFCTCEDGAIHSDTSGALAGSEQACQALAGLGGTGASGSSSGSGGSGSSGSGSGGSGSGGSGSGSSGSGSGNGNGNNGNGNGNGGGNGSNGGGNGNATMEMGMGTVAGTAAMVAAVGRETPGTKNGRRGPGLREICVSSERLG